MKEFAMSERRACRLVELDRSSYRYEPRADHNAELREELVKLARQKPRYGYRRLHVLLDKRGHPASAQRIYRLYREETADGTTAKEEAVGASGERGTAVVALEPRVGTGLRL
jgi:putative transposase